jgi:hypothetical protein
LKPKQSKEKAITCTSHKTKEECDKIGEDINILILQYQHKIKKYQSILSNNKNKICYEKIKNLVKDLRNKTALYLCKNYNNIIIPEFKSQQMLKKNKENANINEMKEIFKWNISKFVLGMLSHYTFRQHLTNKCSESGCNIIICTEEYTSQCCCYCGLLSKTYN